VHKVNLTMQFCKCNYLTVHTLNCGNITNYIRNLNVQNLCMRKFAGVRRMQSIVAHVRLSTPSSSSHLLGALGTRQINGRAE
jgi:hypothetical protein